MATPGAASNPKWSCRRPGSVVLVAGATMLARSLNKPLHKIASDWSATRKLLRWYEASSGSDYAAGFLRIFGGHLVQHVHGAGKVVYPEDHQGPRRSGLQPAVGVVDVDLFVAQSRGCPAQLTRTVHQPHYRNFRLLEDHAQAAQHRIGAGRIVHHESRQALALLYIRLESQDVHAPFRQRQEALPQRARLVLNRYGKLFRFRHAI